MRRWRWKQKRPVSDDRTVEKEFRVDVIGNCFQVGSPCKLFAAARWFGGWGWGSRGRMEKVPKNAAHLYLDSSSLMSHAVHVHCDTRQQICKMNTTI